MVRTQGRFLGRNRDMKIRLVCLSMVLAASPVMATALVEDPPTPVLQATTDSTTLSATDATASQPHQLLKETQGHLKFIDLVTRILRLTDDQGETLEFTVAPHVMVFAP